MGNRLGKSETVEGLKRARTPGKPWEVNMESAAFCCDIQAMSNSERERYQELRGRLQKAIEETKELESGYAFRLGRAAVSLMEVAEWVDKERKCCPFFDFEIAVERDGGPVWLTLRGREGVKPFMRMEFGAL
jgi:hypothetical protein